MERTPIYARLACGKLVYTPESIADAVKGDEYHISRICKQSPNKNFCIGKIDSDGKVNLWIDQWGWLSKRPKPTTSMGTPIGASPNPTEARRWQMADALRQALLNCQSDIFLVHGKATIVPSYLPTTQMVRFEECVELLRQCRSLIEEHGAFFPELTVDIAKTITPHPEYKRWHGVTDLLDSNLRMIHSAAYPQEVQNGD